MSLIAMLYDSINFRDWGGGQTHLLPSERDNGLYYLTPNTVYKDRTLIKSGPNNTHVYQLHPIPEFYIALSIVIKKKRAKILDVMKYSEFLLMSEKALKILDDIDDIRHQRYPVDITLWDGSTLAGNYHLVHPLRSIEWPAYTGPDINSNNTKIKFDAKYVRGMLASAELKDFISQQHLWRSDNASPYIYMGEALVLALTSAGCSGVDLKQMEKIKKNSGALIHV
jgi:hypothetical protein